MCQLIEGFLKMFTHSLRECCPRCAHLEFCHCSSESLVYLTVICLLSGCWLKNPARYFYVLLRIRQSVLVTVCFVVGGAQLDLLSVLALWIVRPCVSLEGALNSFSRCRARTLDPWPLYACSMRAHLVDETERRCAFSAEREIIRDVLKSRAAQRSIMKPGGFSRSTSSFWWATSSLVGAKRCRFDWRRCIAHSSLSLDKTGHDLTEHLLKILTGRWCSLPCGKEKRATMRVTVKRGRPTSLHLSTSPLSNMSSCFLGMCVAASSRPEKCTVP